MIITSLELNNFGPFKNRHTFTLNPAIDKKPVVIVMGHNGAGKTTLLEALQLGLYGAFSWGLKNMSPRYQALIKQKYNRKANLENPEGEFSIAIGFKWRNGRNIDDYLLERKWWINLEGKLYETTNVIRNEIGLDEKDAFEFQEKIRSFLPPSLIEFFLFDGERIDYILRNADFSTILRDGAMNLFGLDIASRLQKDLRTAFNKNQYRDSLSKDEEELFNVNKALDTSEQEYESLLNRIRSLEVQKDELIAQRERLFSEFKLHGGLMVEEQRKLEQKIKELEFSRAKINEKIKESIAEVLPFQMVFPLLEKTVQRIEAEKNSRDLVLAHSTVVEKGDFLLSEWKKKVGDEQADISDKFFEFLVEQLGTSKKENYIFDFSVSEIRKIQYLYELIKDHSIDQYSNWFEEIDRCTTKIQSIRKRIEINIKENSLEATWRLIEEIDQQLLDTNSELKLAQEKANESLKELEQLRLNKEKIISKINEVQKDESVVNLADRISLMMEEYKKKSLEKQVVRLGMEIKKQFVNLLQKKDYISSVSIDSDSFSLTLLGKDGDTIPAYLLSAGERQLLLLAIIKAFLKVSGRELPLVLDTLMGRLDLKHRDAILTRFLLNSDLQTIVLATDSEFSLEEITKLSEVVSKVYHISYNEKLGVTEVIDKEGVLA